MSIKRTASIVRQAAAFTLVELLVVIGIIALLISILLPSLSKAREQANTVACASTMRQFYQLWQMYATQNKGFAVPARWSVPGAEYDFFEPQFLGSVLKANEGGIGAGSGTVRAKDLGRIIKQVFQCKSIDHSADPSPEQATAVGSPAIYYGDYIYNTWMGSHRIITGATSDDQIDPATNIPIKQVGKVPGNVIILMESNKPNVTLSGGTWTGVTAPSNVPASIPNNGYKAYFQKNSEIWAQKTLTAGQPASDLVNLRYGTPHTKNKKMNVLTADGRIVLVDPKVDFFMKPGDQSTVKDWMWDAKASAPFTSTPGWRKGAEGL